MNFKEKYAIVEKYILWNFVMTKLKSLISLNLKINYIILLKLNKYSDIDNHYGQSASEINEPEDVIVHIILETINLINYLLYDCEL